MSTALITLLELATTAVAIFSCVVQVFAVARSMDAETAWLDSPAAISWPVDSGAL